MKTLRIPARNKDRKLRQRVVLLMGLATLVTAGGLLVDQSAKAAPLPAAVQTWVNAKMAQAQLQDHSANISSLISEAKRGMADLAALPITPAILYPGKVWIGGALGESMGQVGLGIGAAAPLADNLTGSIALADSPGNIINPWKSLAVRAQIGGFWG